MPRKHDPTKARRHWVYSREEVREMYGVCDGTISNWVRAGLEPVDNKRPQLFAGYKLRRFVTNMRWPGGRPPQKWPPVLLSLHWLQDTGHRDDQNRGN